MLDVGCISSTAPICVHVNRFTLHRIASHLNVPRCEFTFALDLIAHFVDIENISYMKIYIHCNFSVPLVASIQANLHKQVNAIAFNTWRCNLFVNVNAPRTHRAMNTCGFDWQRHASKVLHFAGVPCVYMPNYCPTSATVLSQAHETEKCASCRCK